MRRLLGVLLALVLSAPAMAALTPADLSSVDVDPPAGARAPVAVRFKDETGLPATLGAAMAGKPTVLVFADYRCRTLCGPALVLTAAGLAKAGLKPGADYRLVVVGLRPGDDPAAGQTMAQQQLGPWPTLKAASTFLTGDAASVRAATAALGFRYRYDAANDQFAHEAAAYALTPDGRVARVLSELNLSGPELRLALVGAGQGHLGSLTDRLKWLCVCYGFDPAAGLYNGGVDLALKLGATLIVALVGAWAARAWLRSARP
jgi:protein SCO1/2